MKFITSKDHAEGTQALANKISSFLKKGTVLWLIPGGSNIPIAVDVMNAVRNAVPADVLSRLTITLTDERYGPVGHPDSNWKQLQDAGFNFDGIKAYPILDGSALADTVVRYRAVVREIVKTADVIVGQFGMGADGHIAGILPHTPAAAEEKMPTSGYESKPFTRVTITFPILRKINSAYMFVSNADKKTAIARLHSDGVPLLDQPAQILKELPEAFVFVV